MKIRVTAEKGVFLYGNLRPKGFETTLVDVEHSTAVDKDGEPLMISAKEQFNPAVMENADEIIEAEDKEPSEMTKPELVAALTDAEIELPKGKYKKDMVALLEDHLTS